MTTGTPSREILDSFRRNGAVSRMVSLVVVTIFTFVTTPERSASTDYIFSIIGLQVLTITALFLGSRARTRISRAHGPSDELAQIWRTEIFTQACLGICIVFKIVQALVTTDVIPISPERLLVPIFCFPYFGAVMLWFYMTLNGYVPPSASNTAAQDGIANRTPH